jgi:hypothetical protein
MQIVTATLPQRDGCPILTRCKAFLIPQELAARLEHTLRDRQGAPLDLTTLPHQPLVAELRIAEWLVGAQQPEIEPPVIQPATVVNAAGGVVQADWPDACQRPGIYRLNWGVRNSLGQLVAFDTGIASVERTLFGTPQPGDLGEGPITLQEMRMRLMDSSRNENTLLDDVEFSDEQILLALAEPIRLWNETPPAVCYFTSRDFPFHSAWATGALAKLYELAAAHYRRNFLQTVGGGVQIADKAKERDYMQEALRCKQEYESWMANKKVELNMRLFVGHMPSPYVWRQR